MRKIPIMILLITGVTFLVNKSLNTTYAYTYDINKTTLLYKENYQELANDIKEYISLVDDYIIPNSNFELSNTLDENYDFLVNFALDYILSNKENYQDYIITSTNFDYLNQDQLPITTNQYVDVELLYNITDKYFGIKDFYILNSNITIENNYISIINNTDRNFTLLIEDVQVYEDDNYLKSIVIYENHVSYLYTFKNQFGVLKLKNIEVIQ